MKWSVFRTLAPLGEGPEWIAYGEHSVTRFATWAEAFAYAFEGASFAEVTA